MRQGIEMAKTITEEIVCDKCGNGPATHQYTVQTAERVVILDLDDKCAKTLDALLAKGTTGPRTRTGGGPERRQGHAVIPVD